MPKYLTHIVFLVALCISTAKAQYITLPDKAFVQFLADSFPSVLNAQQQLDTTKAKTISAVLNARNRGIVDATGIQYFASVTEIQLGKNKLTTFPRIDKLQSLTTLYLDSNQLKSIPDLRAVSNLNTLNVYLNDLDSLPDFNNLTNLQHFLIAGNKIKQLPDFTGCTNLQHIVANSNKISVLPDFTKNKKLNRVLFSYNLFKTADFSKMPSVTQVHFVGNLLTDFPNISGFTNLTELRLGSNRIDSMPDLSAFVNLVDFDISNNFYTFETLAKFNPNQTMTNYLYYPQQDVGQADTVIKRLSNSYTLTWPVQNPLSTNQYTWYKDGTILATGSNATYVIPKLDQNSQGSYSIECRNASYPQLVLRSKSRLIQVIDCFDLSQLKVNYTASNCKYPIQANVDENTIAFGSKPFSYQLINTISNEATTFTSSQLTIGKEGAYDLVLIDSTGCKQVLKKYIQTTRPDNCDPIFYPGLNGPESNYFIDQKGTARIYNNAGHKLKELSVPAYWDGKDNNGQLLDSGLYLIIVNEQVKIPISLMRVN